MSPPAQKPRSPSPVISTAAICGSNSKSSSAADMMRTISSVRLLIAFGLFRRMRPNRPALSTRTGSSRIFVFSALTSTSCQLPRSFLADECPRHNHSHDLIGSFQDLMDPQIAHDLLDPVFRQIAVAAMQLERLISDIKADVGDEALGHGAELCRVGGLGIERARGSPKKCAGSFELGRHVGQTKLQSLEIGQHLPEGPSLSHI